MRILESTSSNPLDRPLEDTIWWTWCKSSNVYTRYMHTGVTNKHNGRRPDFLIVADLSVISVHVLYIRVHLTRMDTVRVLVLYILAWIPSVSTAYPLVPRVNASICFAPLCFVPPLFLHPLYPPPQSIVSSSTYDALVVTFVRSFVRVTLGESTLPFRRLQCATVPLFSTLLSLLSGTSSLPHSSSPPDHLLPTLSPSSCLPLFLGHVFPWPTGIFPPLFFPYIRMYIWRGCRVRVQCLAPVISCGCARKNVESDVLLDREWKDSVANVRIFLICTIWKSLKSFSLEK